MTLYGVVEQCCPTCGQSRPSGLTDQQRADLRELVELVRRVVLEDQLRRKRCNARSVHPSGKVA